MLYDKMEFLIISSGKEVIWK